MTDTQWFEDMALAMKAREKARNAITRWTKDLEVAEQRILDLRSSNTDATEESPQPREEASDDPEVEPEPLAPGTIFSSAGPAPTPTY